MRSSVQHADSQATKPGKERVGRNVARFGPGNNWPSGPGSVLAKHRPASIFVAIGVVRSDKLPLSRGFVLAAVISGCEGDSRRNDGLTSREFVPNVVRERRVGVRLVGGAVVPRVGMAGSESGVGVPRWPVVGTGARYTAINHDFYHTVHFALIETVFPSIPRICCVTPRSIWSVIRVAAIIAFKSFVWVPELN